jgi:hypothetical protein
MFFAPPYTPHERSVVAALRLLGFDGERDVLPRREFRDDLRTALVGEASLRSVA